MTTPRPLLHPAPLRIPRWWTCAEIARALRVSKMTVYRLMDTGELPAQRFGRSRRVRDDVLRAYVRGGAEAVLDLTMAEHLATKGQA